ncbi:MAG: UDP-3-O-(3-hydroxymyristoyl)glucosamine N-acyltransferase [Lachnoclostridium sp.]|nr:UDP-3-O-(3-hydroxymyristoyl)glucosamine N-acyltransferase [Lachnoclostridium sp.]
MELTASQLAAMVNGTVEGDGEARVNTFAKIEEGHEGALSFLANPKYTHYIYDTLSTIVLVSRDFTPEHLVKATLIRVDDPYATVAMLLTMVEKMAADTRKGIEQPSFIAPDATIGEDVYVGAFAYISPRAVIGKGAKIYPQVFIGDDVTIGENTVLYPGVKVYKGCHIGARCIIHSGAVIGADGFGFAPVDGHYEKIPQTGIVEIADDVEIGANTTIDRAMMDATRIEHGVKLDNLIQVAHNCVVGHDTVIAAQAGMAGSSKLGGNCMIGGQVGIVGHITISDGTVIGAQSGVNKGSRPGDRLMGTPAVDMGEYARNLVYVKKLASLYERVSDLEKQLKQK